MDAAGRERIGRLSDHAFLAAGAALYAGEGAKGGYEVNFANTDPAMIAFHCAWLRRFFDIDESRLRVRVYLHEAFGERSTSPGAPTSATAACTHIARSWVSCAPCYRRTRFRGSSIGRATDC